MMWMKYGVKKAMCCLRVASPVIHILWVAFIMKINVTFDPADIGLFSADAIVFETDPVTNLI